MGEIREYVKALKKLTLKRQERDIFQIIYSKHSDTILDLNTEQLMHGEDSQGSALDPFYQSVKYAEFKLYLNPLGVVDLRLTGSFQGKFYIIKSGGFPIRIYSKDKKTSQLVAKYGADIFGLQKKNEEYLAQNCLSDIQEYYRGVLRIR